MTENEINVTLTFKKTETELPENGSQVIATNSNFGWVAIASFNDGEFFEEAFWPALNVTHWAHLDPIRTLLSNSILKSDD